MDCIVFVPGIMGTRLSAPGGDEVWPPTVLETQLGYQRKAELMRDDLVVGDIIRNVWCAEIYEPLIAQLKDIGYPEAGGAKRLVLFPYDWRRDLENTAALLAERLRKVAADGATSITLVSHSMGGLICRLVLESGTYAGESWFPKVKALLTLATPHLGAPLALARVLGLDGALGISGADFREFAGDRRFPSGYQLLPAPGEAACWDAESSDLQPLDIYAAGTASRLGLKPELLARARFVHDTLRAGTAPDHVRYFLFAGVGHKTVTRINVGDDGARLTTTDDAGDGTVPLWSALPRSLQKQLVPGDHSGFFKSKAFKAVFYRLLGASFPIPPLMAAETVELSVQSLVLRPDQPIDALLAPLEPVARIEGSIIIERTDDPEKPFKRFRDPAKVVYMGPETPQLKLLLPPLGETGQYRATFLGEPGRSEPVVFAVARQ